MTARHLWLLFLPLCGCDDSTESVPDVPGPPVRDASRLPPPMRPDSARPTPDAALDGGATADARAETPGDAAIPDAGDEPDAPPDPDAFVPPDPDAGPPAPDAAPPADPCRDSLAAATYTFEGGPEGWVHAVSDGAEGAANWPFDPWELGAPRSGPGGCAEGASCWGTDLDDNVVQCQRAELVSPLIDLRACAGREVELVFDHWYAFLSFTVDGVPYADGGVVEGGAVGQDWHALDPLAAPGGVSINPDLGGSYRCVRPDDFHVDGQRGYSGSSDGWVEARHSLGGDHAVDQIRVRFAFATGVSLRSTDPAESRAEQLAGWYVDHVRFELRE